MKKKHRKKKERDKRDKLFIKKVTAFVISADFLYESLQLFVEHFDTIKNVTTAIVTFFSEFDKLF